MFRLKSADIDRNDYLKNDNPAEFGLPGEVVTYRQMLKDVRDKYRDTPQVVWVEDAVGISSLFALGWPRMYMVSDARLFGLYTFKSMVEKQWEDPDVRSKMVAAWTGIMKGLVEVGGYPREVADALIFPESRLSVSFEGRGAKWASDTSGVWVVDSSNEAPSGFDAQLSEDTMLSDGTADTFDDLMYLLGYREFQKIDSGEKVGEQFVKEWREAMADCFKNLEDAQETEDSVVGLGKRKTLYEKTIALMKRYPMIEKRREMQERGVSVVALEGAVDDIKKEIQRQREAEKQGRQGGGGRGLGGGGMSRPGRSDLGVGGCAPLTMAFIDGGATKRPSALELSDGRRWRGTQGERVRVTHTLAGREGELEGVIVRLEERSVTLEVEEAGRLVRKFLTSYDLRKVERIATADSLRVATQESQPGSAEADAGAPQVSQRAPSTSAKQTIFILPWGRGPGGDAQMVGLGARHDEIEKIAAEADKLGPGQIIILEINSGGGLVTEGDLIDETLNKIRERHRVIAWVHEAISAAAFTALHCNEIYFQRVGTLGAITMFRGTEAIKGVELEAWLEKVGDVCEATSRNRWVGEAMVTNEPELSYDRDDEGNVTWYDTLQGKYDLSDKVQNLTINAQQAEHSKFSHGTADTLPDLLKLLDLSPAEVEISQVGYQIHIDWQRLIRKGREEKAKLLGDFTNPKGLTMRERLAAQLRAAKEIRKWFDRCQPVMELDGDPIPDSKYWDDVIEGLGRELRRAKDNPT